MPVARLDVVVTAYNRADFLDRCLSSVLASASDTIDVRVIVMDNGSTDGTAETAAAFGERIRVLRTSDNRPIVEVLNRGLDAAIEDRPDCILVMNDDTEFAPGAIERLMSAAEAHPNSVMTPLQLNYREPGRIDDNAYRHVAAVRDLIEDAVVGRPLRQTYPLPTIIGAAMFARREVWEAVGGFDPLFWFYGVDDDVCARARWIGYEVLLVPQAHLFHAHGKLDVPPASPDPAAVLRKWRNETQARYLFVLKDPNHRFAVNVARALGAILKTSVACLFAAWPRGAWEALTIGGHCLARLRRIARTRKLHFDPARRRKPGA